VQRLECATGHAVVMVDRAGENAILLHGGANQALSLDAALAALEGAEMGDILLMQNETAHQAAMAQAAQARGMEVVYSAAPFDLGAVQAVLPFVNMLVMNAVEAGQLQAAMAVDLHDLPVETVVVTRGGDGASWHARGLAGCCGARFANEGGGYDRRGRLLYGCAGRRTRWGRGARGGDALCRRRRQHSGVARGHRRCDARSGRDCGAFTITYFANAAASPQTCFTRASRPQPLR
jgi:hypothetical protein